MATALSLNPLLRHSVGFDRFNDLFDNLSDNSRNAFPPYDIIKTAENSYQIVMAVAGYDEKDIHIVLENGTLKVSGKHEADNTADVEYLHKGIAKRAFEQSYRLADHMQVRNAQLINGILTISLEREIPDAQKPQLIAINQSD
jgi:molecular chaperone IbpA